MLSLAMMKLGVFVVLMKNNMQTTHFPTTTELPIQKYVLACPCPPPCILSAAVCNTKESDLEDKKETRDVLLGHM